MSATGTPLAGLQRIGLVLGAVGLIAAGMGAMSDPVQFYQSWLLNYLYWLGIPLGSFGFLVLQNLTNGAWGFVAKRIWEASATTMVLMAVLFLPIVYGMESLYPWANPEVVAAAPLLQHKAAYLNPDFFMARAALYFAIWAGIAWLIRSWSRNQDASGDPALSRKQATLSGAAIPLFVLTLTFAATDWAMSLEPEWFSTMYGLIFLAGYGLSTLSFTAFVLSRVAGLPPLAAVVKRSHFNDLGSLMLAFTMLWAYLSFSQYLIIWAGNLPEEIGWYLARTEGGWQYIGTLLLVAHFVLPFLLLLWRRNKDDIHRLVRVAMWILAIRWVDVLFQVKPAFSPGHLGVHWMDIALLFGIGGIWLAFFTRVLAGAELLPKNDPRVLRKLGAAEAH